MDELLDELILSVEESTIDLLIMHSLIWKFKGSKIPIGGGGMHYEQVDYIESRCRFERRHDAEDTGTRRFGICIHGVTSSKFNSGGS